MKTIPLGGVGTQVSVLGIGALSFTDFYGSVDEQQSHKILSTALDLGINHIDTSNVYGAGISEVRIGSFLKTFGVKRHELFKIATKAGIVRSPEGGSYFDNSLKHLESELDGSLQRLGLEQVELFYVHRRDPNTEIEEVTESLVSLIKKGKINQFGFSEISPASLVRASAVHPVAAVQSEYSLATRFPELGLVQRCLSLDTTLVAFSPVGRSLLTNNPHDVKKAGEIDFLKGNPRFMSPNLEKNILATEVFRQFANDMGYSAATVAIAWLLAKGPHILPIPGTRSSSRLIELAKGTELNLTESDILELESLLPVGWAHGDRYSLPQWVGAERYS